MNRIQRNVWAVLAAVLLLHPAAAEDSVTVMGTAGGAGLDGGVLPMASTTIHYQHTGFLAEGDGLSTAIGIGYVGLGYSVPTAVGLMMAQATAAPFAGEYAVAEEGQTVELAMEAPLYRGDVTWMIPAEALTVMAHGAIEARDWRSTDSEMTTPADVVALDNAITIEYRLRERSWTSNPLAPTAGWKVSGGYRNVFRPGYRTWGDAGDAVSHNGAPQHQITYGGSVVVPLGGNDAWSALGVAIEQEQTFNAYDRDRPRYGHPADGSVAGVSGYAPGSLPSDNANIATVSLAKPVGDVAVFTFRFDWLHRHDDGEDERRGLGLAVHADAGAVGRFNFSAGVALDPHDSVDVPLTGSVTWIKAIGIGG